MSVHRSDWFSEKRRRMHRECIVTGHGLPPRPAPPQTSRVHPPLSRTPAAAVTCRRVSRPGSATKLPDGTLSTAAATDSVSGALITALPDSARPPHNGIMSDHCQGTEAYIFHVRFQSQTYFLSPGYDAQINIISHSPYNNNGYLPLRIMRYNSALRLQYSWQMVPQWTWRITHNSFKSPFL